MSLPRLRIIVVTVAAVAVTTTGVVRLAITPDAPAQAADQATVDSLTTQVTTADWTNMDHDMSGNAPGYQMPPAMMPGMPEEGEQRLAVSVTVVNSSDETRPLRPGKEFTLRAGENGGRWTPHSDTFGDLPRLAPRNAIRGILFFDLPPADLADSSLWLEWTHGDTTSRLTVPADGVRVPPSHSHNP
jgi:hypothetical protein